MVRVLYLIENGSYRFDHRARREVCSLRDAGCKVHVVCPAYKGESLRETMVTGGDVCQYVSGGDPRGLADKVMELADDPKLRKKLGKLGRKRVEDVLSWPHQAPNLLRIYEDLYPGQITWPETACASA